jgi:hypothetical protein
MQTGHFKAILFPHLFDQRRVDAATDRRHCRKPTGAHQVHSLVISGNTANGLIPTVPSKQKPRGALLRRLQLNRQSGQQWQPPFMQAQFS